MRKIVDSTDVSRDGVVEKHLWPRIERLGDAVLMGRRTYDVFAPAWSARSGDPSGDPLSDRMNTIPKYVASTTLEGPGVGQHDSH